MEGKDFSQLISCESILLLEANLALVNIENRKGS